MTEEKVLCKVCKLGMIITRIEYYSESISRSFWDTLLRRGPKFQQYTKSNIHCNVCGVKYEFVPGENLKEPEPFQISPGLFTVKKSSSIFSKNR